ncbi:AMP-binding protein [Microbacterium telephonicum]|uniref:Acyl-CoA synthetase (AMP-forming)/AMP-acid ligase II n=1 Tax=Microbacterium telephonicum TaxID=1714841 RepID=A0A498C375_9MICO|nr:acyl-CoA synthetase (AMP-forming)/AMP-acid ligase II [Microbacterium telephonicum]
MTGWAAPDDDLGRVALIDGATGAETTYGALRAQVDAVAERGAPPAVIFDPADRIAVLPYSSGTTGKPKGVMLSHRNLVANVAQCRVNIDLRDTDRMLAVLPFFHIYGMTVLLNLALRQRATLVTMPKFDLAGFLENIQRHRCTYLYIAPPIAVALAKHPMVGDYDLSSVHTVFSGAAPLDGETAETAGRRIGARMMQGYGMSELSPVSHAMPHDRDDVPVSSVGTALPNTVCKLVDTETGDVAVYHEGGWFQIVDRVKELIKYKGYQVAPAELEALLLSHPAILDAAVIGVRVEDGEEIPKAFVVAAPQASLTADEVMDFVAGHVAPHKKVHRVEFIEAVPKSASGKILRKDLRAREAAPA